MHQPVDRVPAAFEAVGNVKEKLMKHYGFTEHEQLMDKFGIDIVYVGPKYVGPELKKYINDEGKRVQETFWGYEETFHNTGIDTYATTSYFPLNGIESVEEMGDFKFPDPDWFDYSTIEAQCDKYPDKAVVVGHEGPFQIVTYLMEMDQFFIAMATEPELAEKILEGISKFELEYYKRIFEAGKGKIDVLRTHDDYGTQISLLFSMDMWREFYKENTKKLVDLTHSYNAFFQQHSCGAVGPIIPELIQCGVDALEPIQKVEGLEVETLAQLYDSKIAFHGGVDTQQILPYGTVEEVKAETEKFIQTLGKNSGYILMASQGFEGDVPIENIEAVYSVSRVIKGGNDEK